MKGKVAAIVAAGALALASPVIINWEGKSNVAYLDPVGIPTICYGHTATAAPGRTATDDECEGLLQDDMQVALTGLVGCIDKPLAPEQWAALTSWTYNVGVSAACGSTLVRKINAGKPSTDWCMELDRWVYAGGKRFRGLERRRAEERELCLSGGDCYGQGH